jgi:hypothetical protein
LWYWEKSDLKQFITENWSLNESKPHLEEDSFQAKRCENYNFGQTIRKERTNWIENNEL